MNKIGRKFVIIGIVFLMISVSLFGYNTYEEYEAGKKSADVLSMIQNNMGNRHFDVVGATLQEEKEMETISVDEYEYIGTLMISSLNLELPVMSEWDEDRLRIAPCRYYGSVYTNDLILCAHSYKTHFGYLSKLKQGDTIIFTDCLGEVFVYEVLEIEVLNSHDVSLMIENDFDLTLYTCTSDGMSRITVRCNRVSS